MTDPGQPISDVSLLLSGTNAHLACGADVDELLEQAADGHAGQLTDHQRDCLHCQAALKEFGRVWEPVRSLAAEHVAVPAALKTAVASQIRKLVADVWYTLHLSDGGAIRIAARVVATDRPRGRPGRRWRPGRLRPQHPQPDRRPRRAGHPDPPAPQRSRRRPRPHRRGRSRHRRPVRGPGGRHRPRSPAPGRRRAARRGRPPGRHRQCHRRRRHHLTGPRGGAAGAGAAHPAGSGGVG